MPETSTIPVLELWQWGALCRESWISTGQRICWHAGIGESAYYLLSSVSCLHYWPDEELWNHVTAYEYEENRFIKMCKMENRKENKMGIMPVPKLVISMSLPIMVSMLIKKYIFDSKNLEWICILGIRAMCVCIRTYPNEERLESDF